jgi:hypothetical protein
MRTVGTKTLATLTLLGAAGAGAAAVGVLDPRRLLGEGEAALFGCGAFAALVGALAYRLFGLSEPSRQAVRVSAGPALWEAEPTILQAGAGRAGTFRITLADDTDGAFELGRRAQRAICTAVALLLALACSDRRTVGHLKEFVASSTGAGGSQVCPPPGAGEAPPVSPAEVSAIGCALVQRAYTLGYASSLGDCAPKAPAPVPRPVCTLRQADEPSLHYAWRLWSGFTDGMRRAAGAGDLRGAYRAFQKRADHLPALAQAEEQVLRSAPRASIHLWTNLPDPGDATFGRAGCEERYRRLPHRLAPGSDGNRGGRLLEHLLGQLLYEERYEPAAGSCRELHLHFGAAPDVCARLAKDPAAVLAESGALADVRALLARRRVQAELAALAGEKEPGDASAYLGFYCYVAGAAAERTHTPFTLDGEPLVLEELHAPATADPAGELRAYDAVARLLARGFGYGALLSEAGLTRESQAGLDALLGGDDLLLTRLYGLAVVDLYLDDAGIARRADLLEVYPYERHLKNFVAMFRRQYRREKGRL